MPALEQFVVASNEVPPLGAVDTFENTGADGDDRTDRQIEHPQFGWSEFEFSSVRAKDHVGTSAARLSGGDTWSMDSSSPKDSSGGAIPRLDVRIPRCTDRGHWLTLASGPEGLPRLEGIGSGTRML